MITIPKFQKTILDWFEKNGRHDLPWRKTADPYLILVSEIMLQQTQVERVKEKYAEFLEHFATHRKLAKASPADVLRVWKGLGYNRRALFLQKAAQKINTDFKGHFPDSVEEMETLPGVGPYTARAVSVFAFNNPEVFIETNIRRVFLHFFFFGKEKISDAELFPFIKKALYKKNPRLWYNALMDYGALALSDIPNPNKRSKHYVKQSRFEGSRRYARAKILDFLLKNKSASLPRLQEFFQTDQHLDAYIERPVLLSILKDLSQEGFFIKKPRGWSLITKA